MAGLLLDTHALYWLVTAAEALSDAAFQAIGESQAIGRLHVSPISAWELALAAAKPRHRNPPELGVQAPGRWFSAAVAATGSKVVPIKQRIASEAANVASMTGHRDPGDCYLIATARTRHIPIITRDALILDMADKGYVDAIRC